MTEERYIAWADFVHAFYARYFYEAMRTSKEREFLSLTQGSMSVDECTNRYIAGLQDELGVKLNM